MDGKGLITACWGNEGQSHCVRASKDSCDARLDSPTADNRYSLVHGFCFFSFRVYRVKLLDLPMTIVAVCLSRLRGARGILFGSKRDVTRFLSLID